MHRRYRDRPVFRDASRDGVLPDGRSELAGRRQRSGRAEDRRGIDHRLRPVQGRLQRGKGRARASARSRPDSGTGPAAAQFHELVEQLVDWGRQGDVSHVPKMRIQPVAARAVAEALADLATGAASATSGSSSAIPEIAGPREESLVDLARQLIAHRGESLRIEGVSDPDEPDLYEGGALLPHEYAVIAGPTFEDWLGEQPRSMSKPASR